MNESARSPAPKVSTRIALAKQIVDENRANGIETTIDALANRIGAGMKAYESVPFCLGIFYAVDGDARAGILAAINAGDDADTNGSICGAICGAYSGAKALPAEWVARVEKTSGLDFNSIAVQLFNQI